MVEIIKNIIFFEDNRKFILKLVGIINSNIEDPSKHIKDLVRPSTYIPNIIAAYNSVKQNIDLRKSVARIYLEFVSDHLDRNFDIIPETNKELYGDIYNIPKINNVKINMIYYSVDIKTKQTTDERIEPNIFRVIYALYKIESLHAELKNESVYSIVFNIIPLNVIQKGVRLTNDANRLGIYHKYISAGIYLCKIFDYSSQVTALAGAKEYGDYIFLGDLYNYLFPINKLYTKK